MLALLLLLLEDVCPALVLDITAAGEGTAGAPEDASEDVPEAAAQPAVNANKADAAKRADRMACLQKNVMTAVNGCQKYGRLHRPAQARCSCPHSGHDR